MFVARSAPTLHTLIGYSSEARALNDKYNTYNTFFARNNYSYFTRIFHVLFPDPKFLKFVPFGVNFPSAAHLFTLRFLTQSLRHKNIVALRNSTPNSLLDYPYFSKHQIAITPISKKPFATAVYKLLKLNLNLWFVWPRGFKMAMNYTDVTYPITLLRFMNKYFFKVYSV